MRNPNAWYSRRHLGLAAVLLIVIVIWTTIILLPTSPLALALFVLIGGAGIFIAYRQEDGPKVIGLVAFFSGLVYFFSGVFLYVNHTSNTLFEDVGNTVVFPFIILGILSLVWLAWRMIAPGNAVLAPLKKFVILGFCILIILVLFAVGGLLDYNVRADTSPTRRITVKVVDKWVDSDDWLWMTIETESEYFDHRYSFSASDELYNECDIGSYFEIPVRSGALGYPWHVPTYFP